MFPISSLLPELPLLRIVDVGAMDLGEGTDPYDLLGKALPCEVLGFEPVVEECERRNATARAGCRYLPYVIGDGSEQTFYECALTYNSSLLEPNMALLGQFTDFEELFRVVETKRVRTRRLDDLAEVAEVDFLKMDVQGGELMVLEGAARMLRDVLVVHTEACFAPMYKSQPLFADLDRHLRASGFVFHKFVYFGGYPFKPMPLGQAGVLDQHLWSDVVYVRDFQSFDLLSAEQLLKLAAIVHENYASWGMAARALGQYDRMTGSALQSRYLSAVAAT
jgi:FkbM family methyltransferase